MYKKDGDEEEKEDGEEDENDENKISDEFSTKTNQLLEYIEKTYLKGFVANDDQGKSIVNKMRKAGNPDQVLPYLLHRSHIFLYFQTTINKKNNFSLFPRLSPWNTGSIVCLAETVLLPRRVRWG